MNLMIVESPGKIKKIKEILGGNWDVASCLGHVRDLPLKGIGVEAPDFKPQYEVTQKGAEVLRKLKALVAKSDAVYLATDLDREGEAIAWHLKAALKLNNPQRVAFSEITAKAIKAELARPRSINIPMVAAQEGRRVLDRLVGYMVSPKLIDMSGRSGLSAGRVQSPAVRIVLDRERAINAFVPVLHFGAQLGFPGGWTAEWDTKPFLNDGEKYFLDRDFATAVAGLKTLEVSSATNKERQEAPPAPFITSSLQQAASIQLKMKPRETMAVAQKLYEQGHITYMRTDSPNLSDDALVGIYQVCQVKGFQMASEPRTWKVKGDAQEAHEAIRPSNFELEDAGSTPQEKALYQLIWARAVACQLAPARYATRSALLVSTAALGGKTIQFKASGQTLIDPAWRAVYSDVQDDDAKDKDTANPIPELVVGQTVVADGGKVLDLKTKAPSRFTEASLIKELERLGIGRPSTYASIMETIEQRGYVEPDSANKYLVPTETAALVIDALVAGKFSFIEYGFTGEMNAQLDLVAQGQSTYKEVVGMVHSRLCSELSGLQIACAPTHPCPECGKGLVRRKKKASGGKKGYDFFGCSGYPECTASYETEKNQPKITKKAVKT